MCSVLSSPVELLIHLSQPLIVPTRVLMQEIRAVILTTVEGEKARVDLFFFSDIVVCAVPNERGQLRMCFCWKLRDTWVAPGTPHFPAAIQLMKVFLRLLNTFSSHF